MRISILTCTMTMTSFRWGFGFSDLDKPTYWELFIPKASPTQIHKQSYWSNRGPNARANFPRVALWLHLLVQLLLTGRVKSYRPIGLICFGWVRHSEIAFSQWPHFWKSSLEVPFNPCHPPLPFNPLCFPLQYSISSTMKRSKLSLEP